jgi:adenylate cyclase
VADVFISYARSTEAIAERIAKAVRSAGYSVWRDDQLPAHRSYAEVIEERLLAAKAVIVVWSPDAVKSQWVQAEADRARTQQKLVQLRVDDTPLPIPFDRIECADLRGWRGQQRAPGLLKVLESVAQLVGAPDAAPGGAPIAAPQAAPRPAKRRRSMWLALGALTLTAIFAGAFALWTLRPSGKPVAASIKLTAFNPIGADVPGSVPAAMDQALRDAFGRDNAVVIKEKQVDYVLRGSIERIGEKLHYSVRLESIGDGAALWTTSVDRPADSPVAVRRVAGLTAWVVRCGLSRAAEYPHRLPAHALSLYLTYCAGGGTPQHAIDLAKAVIGEAPDFSRGWSGLAISEAESAWSAGAPEAAALRAQGEKDASQALRLDGRNAEAYMAQAFLSGDGRLAEQEAGFRRALAARPSDCGCEEESYGRFLSATGRFAEANRQTARALDLLPQAPGTLSLMFQGYVQVNDPTRANDILAKMATLYLPDDPVPRAMRHLRAVWTGDWPEAGRTISQHTAMDFRTGLEAAYAALSSRDPTRMAAAAARLQTTLKSADGDPELTEVLAALGARDPALAALEAEVGRNDGLPPASLFDPTMAALRDDPRYIRVLESSGLMAYWRAAHSKPDLCQAPAPPRFCATLA